MREDLDTRLFLRLRRERRRRRSREGGAFPPTPLDKMQPWGAYFRAARNHMKKRATDSPLAKPTATLRSGSGR